MGDIVSSSEVDRYIIKLLRREFKDERKRFFIEVLGFDLIFKLLEEEIFLVKEDVGLFWFCLNKLRR